MFKKTVIGLFGLTLLSGCLPPNLYDDAEDHVIKTADNIIDKVNKAYPKPPAVISEDKPYVNTTPISLIKTPEWLKRQVTLHGNNLPFSFYVSKVITDADALNHYDNTIDKGKLISINYTGTAKGALDHLSAASGYFYELDKKKNAVSWSSFKTVVFDISFMPGAAQYQLGATGALSISGGSAGAGSSGGPGFDFSQDTQYSNLSGTLSVWKDLQDTVKTLLSKEGTANVSESTTTITVHDHPENVAAIRQYINVMNAQMTKQVRLHVQLLEVRLTKNYNYGINWDLVRRTGNNVFKLTGDMAANAGNTGTFTPVAFSFSSTNPNSKWFGSNSIIQALQQQGDVSLITQPTVTTMNDQVATIAIQQQRAYVSGGSGSLNDNTSTTTVNASILTTGFNLYLLPKVQGDKVFLQLSSILSNLTNMRTFNVQTGQQTSSTNPDNSDETTNNSNTPTGSTTPTNTIGPQVIQEPETALRTFNQRSVVPNGATLILAGFIQKANEADNSKFLNSTILGGEGATERNVELVMLITPVILDSHENDAAPYKGYQDNADFPEGGYG